MAKSKRAQAKDIVVDFLNQNKIYFATFIRYDYVLQDLLHTKLEEFGYRNMGTRRCIINEVFREKGMAPNRDSFRRKTYRFEDHTLFPFLQEFNVCKQMDHGCLEQALNTWCRDLGITPPHLEFRDTRGPSLAYGTWRITLTKGMQDQATLAHELSHIYGNVTKDYKNHDARFMAVELALLAYMNYLDLKILFKLARDNSVKVDENYSVEVFNRITDRRNAYEKDSFEI